MGFDPYDLVDAPSNPHFTPGDKVAFIASQLSDGVIVGRFQLDGNYLYAVELDSGFWGKDNITFISTILVNPANLRLR